MNIFKTPKGLQSGRTWKWIHLAMVFVFIVIWILAFPFAFGWINSVAFVAHMSMIALIYAAASAWQAARAEEKSEENPTPQA